MWAVVAPLFLVIIYAVRIYDLDIYKRYIEYENGFIELATPAVLLIGIIIGARVLLRYRQRLPRRWLQGWVALVTLGCVYFAGEEVSWGQWLFHWSTPETFVELNDQKETNIHNISSWFDQKPRMLLELWVLVGGIVVPAIVQRRQLHWDAHRDWRAWFWPTYVCVPTALIAILIKMPGRARGAFDLVQLPLEIQYTETQELYFGVFLMVYLASVHYRLARLIPGKD